MADVKQNTPPQQSRIIGPGGPGGHRGNMHARIMREKPKNIRGTLSKLMKYIGRSKFLMLLLLVVVVSATALNLAGPELQGRAIDSISIDAATGKLSVDFDALIQALTRMGIVYILSALIQFAQGIISARISQTTVYTLRKDLFRKITHLPIQYLDTHKHGDIMSRMTNDVDNVSHTISSSIASLISSVLTLVGALIMLMRMQDSSLQRAIRDANSRLSSFQDSGTAL